LDRVRALYIQRSTMTLVNYFRDHLLHTIFENIEYGKEGNIVRTNGENNGSYEMNRNDNGNERNAENIDDDNNDTEVEEEEDDEENLTESVLKFKFLENLEKKILRLCIRLSRIEIQVPVSSTGTDAICFLVPCAEAFTYNPDFDLLFSDNFRENLDYIGGYQMSENIENEFGNENENNLNCENDSNTENENIENDVNIEIGKSIENSESDSDNDNYRKNGKHGKNDRYTNKNNHNENNFDNNYSNNNDKNDDDCFENNRNRVTYENINNDEKNDKNYKNHKNGKNCNNNKKGKNSKYDKNGKRKKEKSKLNSPIIVTDTPGLSYFRGPFLSGNKRISEYENILKSVQGLNKCNYHFDEKKENKNKEIYGENNENQNENENENENSTNILWHLPDKLKEMKKWEINGLETKELKNNFMDLESQSKSPKNSKLTVSTSNTTSFPFSIPKSVFPSFSSTSSFSPITPIIIPKTSSLQKQAILKSHLKSSLPSNLSFSNSSPNLNSKLNSKSNSRSSSSSSLFSPSSSSPRTTSPPPFILRFGIKDATICNWCNRHCIGEDIKIKGELNIKKGKQNTLCRLLTFFFYLSSFLCTFI
jgi:hypothetical protein